MQITSRQNPLLKEIRRAVAAGKALENGLVAAEGPHLLEEAQRSDWAVERVLATPAALEKLLRAGTWLEEETLIEVADTAFGEIASTEHSQGVVALLRPAEWHWKDLMKGRALVLVLDGVGDPGNAGMLVRSAEAFGATGVLFGHRSVHVANAKFLRGSAGSIFRLPFLSGIGCEDMLERFSDDGAQVWALAGTAGRALTETDLRGPVALVVGNEGAGVSECWRTRAMTLRIPALQVESLNAAVAGSVALFEAFRQRSNGAGAGVA